MATKFKGIKTAAEYRRGELTKDVLRLIGAGVVLGAVVVAPNLAQIVDYFNPRGRAERKRIWNAIHYLERRGHVEFEHRGEDRYVTLTKQGKVRIDEHMIWELAIKHPMRWDKKWRIVMFDVPTRCGGIRNEFRGKLENLGFRPYQRSVFIFPYECHEEVITIAKWYGIHEYVRYVVATEIHDMRRFVHEFDLL